MVIEVSLPASEGPVVGTMQEEAARGKKKVMPSVAAAETASAAKQSISLSNIFFEVLNLLLWLNHE